MDYSRMNKVIRTIAGILFFMYFSYLIYRLFFYAYGQYFRFYENEISYNFIPFKTILSYIIDINKYKPNVWFFNLFGNILAFMPMGFFLPIIFHSLQSFKRITTITFLISSLLEFIQFLLKLGITDIDDVILNTLGGLLGYLLLISSLKIVDKIIIKAGNNDV